MSQCDSALLATHHRHIAGDQLVLPKLPWGITNSPTWPELSVTHRHGCTNGKCWQVFRNPPATRKLLCKVEIFSHRILLLVIFYHITCNKDWATLQLEIIESFHVHPEPDCNHNWLLIIINPVSRCYKFWAGLVFTSVSYYILWCFSCCWSMTICPGRRGTGSQSTVQTHPQTCHNLRWTSSESCQS